MRKALRQAQDNALGIGPSGAGQFPAQGGALGEQRLLPRADLHSSHLRRWRVIQEMRKPLRQAQGNALGIGPSVAEQFPARGEALSPRRSLGRTASAY